jgi:hypothetical protein
MRVMTAWLHLIQPVARLFGRLRSGLTPWRAHGAGRGVRTWPRSFALWSERWRDGDERLGELERELGAAGAVVVRGGEFDRWDVEVRGGLLASARLRMLVEEHGSGKQMVRVWAWPRLSSMAWTLTGVLVALGLLGLAARDPVSSVMGAGAVLAVVVQAAREASGAMGVIARRLAGTGASTYGGKSA